MVIGQGSLETLEAVRRNVGRLLHVPVNGSQSHVRRPCPAEAGPPRLSWPPGQFRNRPRHPRLRTTLQETFHDRPHSSVVPVVRARGCRGAHRAVRRRRAFASLPRHRLRLEARLDRHRRRSAGRRGRYPDRPPRRQHGVAATIVGRDHTTDIALLRTDASLAPVKLAATVPPLGTLSVVVATDRDAPSAALGMVSTVRQELALLARRRHRCADRARRSPALRAARRARARCDQATPSAWPCSGRGGSW